MFSGVKKGLKAIVAIGFQCRHPTELIMKKGVFKNFAKFTRKHLCQSLFFNKV